MNNKFLLSKIQENIISNNGGVYFLKSNYFKNGIRRFKKNDTTGLIYIGQSSNLKRRINNLKISLQNNKPEIHNIARVYWQNDMPLLPFDSLHIEYIEYEDFRKKETQLILKYIMEFGELPLLNLQRPKTI